jgi:hypothetical protein
VNDPLSLLTTSDIYMRGEFGDDAIAKPGPSRAGILPATGSWQRLPRHTRMLMDDAMEHLDEDHGAASKSAAIYDQARSTATDADADADADAATYDQARSAATDADADADADTAPVRASAPKSTMKLNKAAALAIFQARAGRSTRGWRSNLSAALGRQYGLTAKTVRDIWNGRTWAKVTKPFWTAEEKRLYEAKEKYKAGKMQYEASKMQACSGHPTPYPTPNTLATHLPCADRLWWPRADRAWTAEEKKLYEEKTKYQVRKMQACSGHPTPYPTPNTLAMHLPCAERLVAARLVAARLVAGR